MSDSRQFLEILSQDEIYQIHLTALRVLEEVGLWLPNQEILGLLQDAGARVDFVAQTVKIPPHLVEASIQKFPPRFTWHSRNPSYSLDMNTINTYFGAPVAAIRLIDLDGSRRLGTVHDGEQIARLCDALPNISSGSTGIDPSNMPIEVLETWYLMTSYIYSSKPVFGRPQSAPYALRMAEVIADSCGLSNDQLPLIGVLNSYSPLYNIPEQLEGTLEYIRRGVPGIIAPEIQAGFSGPATLAGVMVQATAEFLGHATFYQLITPGVPVMFGCVSSIFDMRKMMVPYGASEADLLCMATAQMARYYGIPSRGTGGCSDANILGLQVGVESLMSTLLPLMAGITYVQHGAGLLENTMAVSYEKIVIDDEIIGMARRIVQGIEVTSETLAFDVIKTVGPRGEFIATDHTYRHFSREQFMPSLFSRDKYDIWEAAGGKRIEERAYERVQQVLASHEPEPLPEDAESELQAIFASAQRSVGLKPK